MWWFDGGEGRPAIQQIKTEWPTIIDQDASRKSENPVWKTASSKDVKWDNLLYVNTAHVSMTPCILTISINRNYINGTCTDLDE